MMTVETVLLGEGVAAMSLASVADQLPNHALTVVRPNGAPDPHDHMLGFWNTEGTDFAASGARASWSTWSVVTRPRPNFPRPNMRITSCTNWLTSTAATVAATHGVVFATEANHDDLPSTPGPHVQAQTRCCNISMD